MKQSILNELLHQEAELPDILRKILYEVKANIPKYNTNIETFQKLWKDGLDKMKKEMPFVTIEDEGETVYTGTLSPGCRLCKQGKWDCIFMTMRCNLSCNFCISPAHLKSDLQFSSFGRDKEQVADHYKTVGIKGIAFTGGEPFLAFDALIDHLIFFRKTFPDAYIWLYTNGLLANIDQLSILADCDINEIRFNTAASGYTNPHVLKLMEKGAEVIERITVEIPCIPSHKKNIIDALPHWNDAGLNHLNLHELMQERGSNSEKLEGKFTKLILEDGHITYVSVDSRKTIGDIIQAAHDQTPRISVNECSIQNKLRQITGRRKNIAKITKEPFERITPNGILESCFSWASKSDHTFCDKINYDSHSLQSNDYRYVKLKRRPALSLDGKNQWVAINKTAMIQQHRPPGSVPRNY